MLLDSLKGYTRQGLTRDLLAGLIVGSSVQMNLFYNRHDCK